MAVLGASDAKVMGKTKTSGVLPPVLMIKYRSQDLEVLRASMVNQFILLVRMHAGLSDTDFKVSMTHSQAIRHDSAHLGILPIGIQCCPQRALAYHFPLLPMP